MIMIVFDIKMNSKLFSCASDLNVCKEMNMMNMKIEKKSKMIFFNHCVHSLLLLMSLFCFHLLN